MHQLSPADESLLSLLRCLRQQDYRFVTPTPETHCRVIARPEKRQARDLRDIFGWSLPFAPDLVDPDLLVMLRSGGFIEAEAGLFRSKVRVSGLGANLFVHSAFPTREKDAVFLGPDSYRFVDFLRCELPRHAGARRLVDIGTGAGVGGISAAALLPGARITLTDINPLALRFAAVNARHAGIAVEVVETGSLEGVGGLVDLVVANPPYIVDDGARTYRDGGAMHGGQISYDWTMAAARRLALGGWMLLYTGSAIVEGGDPLRAALERDLPSLGCSLRWREIDPDVFGEELERDAYRAVERIAAIGAVIGKG